MVKLRPEVSGAVITPPNPGLALGSSFVETLIPGLDIPGSGSWILFGCCSSKDSDLILGRVLSNDCATDFLATTIGSCLTVNEEKSTSG